MVFELLSKRVQSALREFNINEPTASQRLAIPLILQRKNVLIISPTGTGKTEAALLPSLDLIYEQRGKGISLIYITPLRSLNRDLLDRITLWSNKLDFRCAVRHGDTTKSERRKQVLMPPDILVTTPETLQILLISKRIKEHLKNVKIVIVDEIHELAEDKRGVQLSIALQRLKFLAGKFQIIGLSATIGEPEKLANFLVGKDENCEIVNASEERRMKIKVIYPSIEELDFKISNEIVIHPEVVSRLRTIKDLTENKNACLVFTNTRTEAEILGSRLRFLGLDFYVHHSSLSTESRTFAEQSLKLGKIKGIVCTSSLELGIDIGNIDYVIQYNSPRQVTRMVQRIGRSGHFIKGIAEGSILPVNIDSFFESYVIVEKAMNNEFESIQIPEKPLDVLAHQIVGIVLDKGKVGINELISIISKAYPYMNITREEVERVIELLETLKPRALIREGEELIRATGSLGYYIENLSMIPDQIQFTVINDKEEFVGYLDESFLAEYGEECVKFVLKGEVWEITKINEDSRVVHCKKAEDIFGAIPSWVGEEIPVTKEIALHASNLRKFVYYNSNNFDLVRSRISQEIVDNESLKNVIDYFKSFNKEEYNLANEKLITLEEWREAVIVNSCYGNRINRTIGKILTYLISKERGKGIRTIVTPYNIIILSRNIDSKTVERIIKQLYLYDIDALIYSILSKDEPLVRYRFLHVAKRFGIIKHDVSIEIKLLENLILAYKNSVVYEETLKEILSRDLDVKGAKDVIRKIATKEIQVLRNDTVSKLSLDLIKLLPEFISNPSQIQSQSYIIEAYKTRLLSRSLTLVCTECWDYVDQIPLMNIQNFSCPYCNSKRVAVTKRPAQFIHKLINSIQEGKINKKIKFLKKRLEIIADYVAKKERLAALTFAANISFTDAIHIIDKFEEEKNDFFIALMNAESKRLREIYKMLKKMHK